MFSLKIFACFRFRSHIFTFITCPVNSFILWDELSVEKSVIWVVFGEYTKRNIHQIELVQHRAARFVFRDYSNYTHVTPMLKQLGWDTLEQRRLSYQLSMFYKIQQGLVGISLPSEVHPINKGFSSPQCISFSTHSDQL